MLRFFFAFTRVKPRWEQFFMLASGNALRLDGERRCSIKWFTIHSQFPQNRPLLALTISLTVLNDGDDLWSADDVQRGHVEKKYLAIIHSACAFTRIFYSWYIRMRCQIAAAARAEKLWKMCWQKVDGGCMRDANGDLWLLNNVENVGKMPCTTCLIRLSSLSCLFF